MPSQNNSPSLRLIFNNLAFIPLQFIRLAKPRRKRRKA